MPVTLQANALLTVAEGLAYLGLGASETDLVADLINRLSDYCEGPLGTHHPIAARAFSGLRVTGDGSLILLPAAWPIDLEASLEIKVSGASQTVWKDDNDGEPDGFDVVIGRDGIGTPHFFSRASLWPRGTAHNPFPISLTYTGGFDPIPGDLKEAAYLILEHFHKAQTKRLTEVTAIAAGPVTPGVSWPLSPSLIPMRARQILDSYRHWVIG